MDYIIDDRRSVEDKAETIGFVVATDSSMSGWGKALGRSIFAVPCNSWDQVKIVEANMHERTEMNYVRTVGKNWRPKLRDGDHLSIRNAEECCYFYRESGQDVN